MDVISAVLVIGLGAGAIVWGAELFAEHLAAASARLGVTSFALALLLAGAGTKSWPPPSPRRCVTRRASPTAM